MAQTQSDQVELKPAATVAPPEMKPVKPGLKDKTVAGIKKVGRGIKFGVQHPVKATKETGKKLGHGCVVVEQKAQPATRCVGALATWVGAAFFFKGLVTKI